MKKFLLVVAVLFSGLVSMGQELFAGSNYVFSAHPEETWIYSAVLSSKYGFAMWVSDVRPNAAIGWFPEVPGIEPAYVTVFLNHYARDGSWGSVGAHSVSDFFAGYGAPSFASSGDAAGDDAVGFVTITQDLKDRTMTYAQSATLVLLKALLAALAVGAIYFLVRYVQWAFRSE